MNHSSESVDVPAPQFPWMPWSRIVLSICFFLLIVLAVLRFDLILLMPTMLVLDTYFRWAPWKTTIFGPHIRPFLSGPRSTQDPTVRGHLVVGVIVLLGGLVAFVPAAAHAAQVYSQSGAVPKMMPGPLPQILPQILHFPGLHAILMGMVLVALGFDYLLGGFGVKSQGQIKP